MRIFTPEFIFRDVTRITPDFLRQQGIRALVLDVDNTLTAHGSQEISPAVLQWLEKMHGAGIHMMIASNNLEARVAPFAKRLGLEYTSFCCKPSPRWLLRAFSHWKLPRRHIALVGDQIFTDALAGHLYGVKVFLVRPLTEDCKVSIRIKRALERPFLAKYYRKGGRLL